LDETETDNCSKGLEHRDEDYIWQQDGDILTTLSLPRMGSPPSSPQMRSMLKGYNPLHYGYTGPIPIEVPFRCWGRTWEVKSSTLGKQAGLGLFACEDIIVRETRLGLCPNIYLFPYCGPRYPRANWDMIVQTWPSIKAYSLLANAHNLPHYTKGVYIDGTPSYTWNLAGYINSGIHDPNIVNMSLCWDKIYTMKERSQKCVEIHVLYVCDVWDMKLQKFVYWDILTSLARQNTPQLEIR